MAVAQAEGYVPVSECVESEEGSMGIHFIRSEEPGVNLERPDFLLYIPDPTAVGGLRLVAIEYEEPLLVSGEEWRGPLPPDRKDIDNSAPELFGHRFDGPMRGHDGADVQPWHYDLHVWAWSPNPGGLFAQYNPSEQCP